MEYLQEQQPDGRGDMLAPVSVRVEILVEESSMASFLNAKLPDMLPSGYILGTNVFIRSHNGKQDLMKSVPKKVQVFSAYHIPARIVIVHDQDSHDCKVLKQNILNICAQSGTCPVLVRIACRELENWYLGDLEAIERAYPAFKAAQHAAKAKFRDPDHCQGADEMKKLIHNFHKGQASRDIPPHIDLSRNRSTSLQQLVRGIRRFLDKP